MSRELIGSNREVVGSPAYFEKLHNAHFSGTLRCSRGDDFARSMESLAGNRYCHLFKPNLERIVRELERDLEQGLRDNDYIRDENADNLRAALKQLERCGVRCYSLERMVDDLAWFVGGDADKIREIQRMLNATGLVSRLQEDGVYGKETAEAEEHIVDRFRENLEEFLLNESAVKYVTDRISVSLNMASFRKSIVPGIGPGEVATTLTKILFDNRQVIQRMIWKQGAEHILRKQGYEVAALLLEHSLERSPNNLHFSQFHQVTRKVMQSKGFQKKYYELESNIKHDPNRYAVSGKMEMNFQETGDTDLYLGIGKCAIKYTCVRHNSTIYVNFTIDDDYNFEELRSFMGGTDRFIELSKNFGSWANDAGFISQADGVISPYKISIDFQKTIETEGVYV